MSYKQIEYDLYLLKICLIKSLIYTRLIVEKNYLFILKYVCKNFKI